MNIITILSTLLQMFALWYKTKLEKDAERKKRNEEILKEVSDGLKARDPSAITAAFDRVR